MERIQEILQTITSSSIDNQRKKALWRFIICSAIGIFCFITPLYWQGQWTIGIGVLAEILKSHLTGNSLQILATVFVLTSAIGSLIACIFKPKFLYNFQFLQTLLTPSKTWLILRILGAIFITMIFFNIGPEWVISPNTGGVILYSLNPVLIPFFLFAVLLLPFLVDYGLMEFVGVLLARPFKIIFKLPGRASIDATASWLGSAPVGVLITAQQYERGYYSQREASVISTNFSIASIAFSLLIVNFISIQHLFLQFYATVVVTGITLAIIMPRIPPLCFKKDLYYTDKSCNPEHVPETTTTKQWAIEQAIQKSLTAPKFSTGLLTSLKVLLDVYLGLMPVVFAIGTIALALSEFTPLFQYLSYPFVPYLELLKVPEAETAAPAMLVGFADMFLPAVLGHGIESDLTKFVIACASMTQIIYLTEVGALILRSKIPLSLLELFVIFVLRTVIGLPIIVLFAHLLI